MDIFYEQFLQEMGGGTDIHEHIIDEFKGASYGHRRQYKITGSGLRLVYKSFELQTNEYHLAPYTEYTQDEIGDHNSVEPDFMIFDNTKYIMNKSRSKIAGQPLFAVEVWSKSNTKRDRFLKRFLYSTSPVTEHWYLEQNSNEIECFLGKKQLQNKSLTEVCETTFGLKLDLRKIAIENRWF